MSLEKLQDDKCSICGAGTVEVRKYRQKLHHDSLNHWNEEREYECGHALTYRHDTNKIEVNNHCPKSPHDKDKRDKREKLLHEIRKVITESDADELFKDSIHSQLKYLLPTGKH